MSHPRLTALLFATSLLGGCATSTSRTPDVPVPMPPWPAGDERGMGNTQGPATRMRCAEQLARPDAREYELSHLRSPTMPSNPFGIPLKYEYVPTFGPPFSRHAVNGESISGESAAQGTQVDALGHFGVLPQPWDPKTGPRPSQDAVYYGGLTQAQVKPTPDSPLLKLGIEKMPPLVTSAVLLDAKEYLGKGQRLAGGRAITAADIQSMLQVQGLGGRGLLPGDVLYIHTGWEELWQDPAGPTSPYYAQGPGLSKDAVELLEKEAIVAIGMDTPFIDAVNEGQPQGKAPPPPGNPPGLPFFAHHQLLSQAGIHIAENMKLAELAKDRVWLSCTLILSLREQGGSGSPVRPVAYGAPGQ